MRTITHVLSLPHGRSVRATISARTHFEDVPVEWQGDEVAGLPHAKIMDPTTLRALFVVTAYRLKGMHTFFAEGEWEAGRGENG